MRGFLGHLGDENVTEHWHWLVVLRPVLVTANLKCHKHSRYEAGVRVALNPQMWLSLSSQWALFSGCGTFRNTHSAFLITLSQHGDGASACFPDHPPKVSHGAWQRTLGGDELIGAKIALEMQEGKMFTDVRNPVVGGWDVACFMLTADTHWDEAGVDVIGARTAWFWQQFHSVVIV